MWLLLFPLKVVLEEAALRSGGEIPVFDQHGAPVGVEAPDGEGDALLLEVFGDMGAVGFRGDDRNVRTRLVFEAESDFRADDGVGVGDKAEILLPLLLPGLGTLHGVGVGDIGDVRPVDGLRRYRGEVIGPVESRAEAHGVGIVGPDGIDNLFLELFPFPPGAGADIFRRDGGLVEQFIQRDGGLVPVPARGRAPESGLLICEAEFLDS